MNRRRVSQGMISRDPDHLSIGALGRHSERVLLALDHQHGNVNGLQLRQPGPGRVIALARRM